MSAGTMAITMAGRGSRFAKAGYDRPKYEIEALGRPLFDWSMLSVEAFRAAGWRFSFAVPADRDAAPFVQRRAAARGIDMGDLLELDAVTDGQATTARLLAEQAPPDRPFAVYNIDTFVAPGAMTPPAPGTGLAGWIPCFPAPGEGWSFARLGADGAVVELREKQRISDHATVGLYWFDSAARYLAAYDAYYAVAGREEKGERYVAPLYNQMIADGERVEISEIALADVGMLGTPEQLAAFIASPPPAATG
jgi:hypothetical protein